MKALITLLIVPLIVLNVAGGLIGGIWLFATGHWQTVLGGIGYGVCSPLVLGLVIMPAIIFAAPSMALVSRGHITLGGIVALPGLAWTQFVIAASCVVVVLVVMGQWRDDAPWPYVLWSYGTAMAPWSFLAQKDAEAGNFDAGGALFFAELGVLSMLFGVLTADSPLDWQTLALWAAPFFVLGLIVQWIGAMTSMYQARSLERFTSSLYE